MTYKHARKGFSLIEVLIAVTISGFLSVMVFQAISFFQKSALRYHEIAQYVRQQELWSRQLEKDLSSIVIPLFGFEQKKEEKAPPESKDPKAPKPAPDKKEQAEYDKKRQEYAQKFIFECAIENGSDAAASLCKSCSWITTNVLRVYDKQKPLLARVRYYLQPASDTPGLYTLYRQELPILDMKELEKTSNDARYTGVPIAYNIKQLRIGFTALERKGKEVRAQELSVWVPKRDEKEKSVQQIPLPHVVSFTGSMVDPRTQHEYPFELFIPLIVAPLEEKHEKSS